MYCPKCGAANPDQSQFCGDCGAKLTVNAPVSNKTTNAQAANRPRVPQGKLCCPKCGNTQLTVITDRDWGAAALGGVVSTAVGGIGSGIMNAASNLQQQTFFICPDCGHRFRNPNELENEARIYGRRNTIISIVSGIMILLCIILIIVASKTGIAFLGILFGIIAVIFVLCIVFMNLKARKPKKELEEIRQGMDRFR